MFKKTALLLVVIILLFGLTGVAAAAEEESVPETSADPAGTESSTDSDSGSDPGSSAAESPSNKDPAPVAAESVEPEASDSDSALDGDQSTGESIAGENTEPAPLGDSEAATEAEPAEPAEEGDAEPESEAAADDSGGAQQDASAPEGDGETGAAGSSCPFEDAGVEAEEPAEEGTADTGGEVVPVNPDKDELDEACLETLEDAELGDPYFFHGGKRYSFFYGGDPGDDDDFNFYGLGEAAIQEAIDHISAHGTTPAGGMVYVEHHTAPYGGFTIDGTLPYLNTLRGVTWDEVGDDKPSIEGYINILNLTSGFTLSGFHIDGTVWFGHNTGQLNLTDLEVSGAGNGININNHQGNVVLTDVTANDNDNIGGYVHNSAGGNVTITNSTFDNNNDSGLFIETGGIVNVNGISASGNDGSGLDVRGFSRLTIRNAAFNSNEFLGLYSETANSAPLLLDSVFALGNKRHGVSVSTAGAVTARNIYALENLWQGLKIANSSGTGAVTVSNGMFNNNSINGIAITTNGIVRVTDVEASENGGFGIRIYQDAPRAVIITRANFRKNGGKGAEVWGYGAVTLTDVSARENITGVYIRNDGDGTGNVTIRSSRAADYYDFSGNDGHGIDIASNGVVSVSNVISDGNGVSGILIENHEAPRARNVSITRGNFDNNEQHGVYILSKGAVTLLDVGASGNGSGIHHHGVTISNDSGTGNVTIRSSRAADYYDFSGNAGSGIRIFSYGVVSISNVNVVGNIREGILIGNHEAPTARNVSITRGSFSDNAMSGIEILSRGAVTLLDVSASNNGSTNDHFGVQIVNNYVGGTGNVTIRSSRATDYFDFSGNSSIGIFIQSRGVVTVGNVVACDNNALGILISNSEAPSARNVSITRGSFSDNGGDGIMIHSKGAVTLLDVSASSNSDDGARINNTWGTGNVTIRSSRAADYYNFSHNGESGISIVSRGVVSVSNVSASNNQSLGIVIENFNALVARNVSITRGNFGDNSMTGVTILSKGAVTLLDVGASGNGTTNYHGVYIKNDYGTGNVTIRSSRATNYYDFSHNGRHGIYIESNGVVSVSNIIACDNGQNGIWIDNHEAPSARNVSITRGNFGDNERSGLYILSKGAVTLLDVSASGNGTDGNDYDGAYIVNTFGVGNVTIRSSRATNYYDFSHNEGHGIYIESNGVITVSNVNAIGNKQRGAEIRNHEAPAARNVSITRGNFGENGGAGIRILSKGAVTLIDVSASGNGARGLHIWNNYGTGNVTIRSSRAANYYDFSGNSSHGIYIDSNGAVTVRNVNTADNNNSGVEVYTTGNSNILLQNITANNNNRGIYAATPDGRITITNVSSFLNDEDGIGIGLGSGSVHFNNCAFTGNGRNGIRSRRPLSQLFFRNTIYFGNTGDDLYFLGP